MTKEQNFLPLAITGFLGSVIGLNIADLLFEDQRFLVDFSINAVTVAICDIILYYPIVAICKRFQKK
ncbi:MAG: hypothetical protein R3Y08_03605 [Rikenellaceae bacterium]